MVNLILCSESQSYIWYVISSSDQPCPNITICHKLSFYVNNAPEYFVSGATFKFMDGDHMLNIIEPKVISNANNLTLTGINVAYSAIPKIHCGNGRFGFSFSNSSSITLNALMLINCGHNIHDSAITITNVKVVKITNFTVKTTKGIGIMLDGVAEVTIFRSHFLSNGLGIMKCSLKSNELWHGIHIQNGEFIHINYTIIESVFIGNARFNDIGGGLFVNTVNTQSSYVFIDQCRFENIIGCSASCANIAIYNYESHAIVQVSDSIFLNNTRLDRYLPLLAQFGGALKIRTHQKANMPYQLLNEIRILNSSFTQSRAKYCAGIGIFFNNVNVSAVVIVKNSQFLNNFAEIRGGGICINSYGDDFPTQVYVYHATNIHFLDSVFIGNEASDGAALLIWPEQTSANVNYNISLVACSFESNKVHNSAPLLHLHEGGIVVITLTIKGTNVTSNIILISNCSFVKNILGPSLFLSNNAGENWGISTAVIKECTFDGNHGSYSTSSGLVAVLRYSLTKIIISNCLFNNNSYGSGGVITIVQYYFVFRSPVSIYLTNVTIQSSQHNRYAACLQCGTKRAITVDVSNITIRNNLYTSGLLSINCALRFNGYNVIANNTAPTSGGGGLVVNGIGYAFTSSNSLVVFENNFALFGGALYSSVDPMTEQRLFLMKCTFLNLNATFINNTAEIAGNDVYGGIMTRCNAKQAIWNSRGDDCKNIFKLAEVPSTWTNASVSSNPYSVFLCSKSNKKINFTTNTTVSVFPGQIFRLPIVTTGYCYSISPGPLKITTSPGIKIVADVQSEQTRTSCEEMNYTLCLKQDVSKGNISIHVDQSNLNYQRSLDVFINISPCPLGLKLSKNGICECEEILKTMVHGIECNISEMPNPITKISGHNNWLTYDKQNDCITVISDCPFDYCSVKSDVHFDLNNSTDRQCNHGRAGTLCGKCREERSLVLGSNACYRCTNANLSLVMLFIVAGFLLVAFLTTLNFTVSVGSIGGILFYANIVKLNEAAFFPNGSIPVVSQIISWLNLDFGFEMCFFNGLDGYWKTWLQFVFPLYILILAGSIVISSRWSIRISHYLRSNIISVIATLILMSFTKILRNVTNALMMTKLKCGTNSQQLVWSIDGNVNYLSVKHLILLIFSCFVLFLAISYTIIILLSQWLQCYCGMYCQSSLYKIIFKIQPFLDAYSGSYSDRHRYWTGLLLLIRLVLTFTFSYTSGSMNYINNYVIISCELILILSLLSSDVYQSQINYIYERISHINLCMLCCINSSLSQNAIYSHYTSLVTTLSVIITLAMFILIVMQQVYKQSPWRHRFWRHCPMKQTYKATSQDEIEPLLRYENE